MILYDCLCNSIHQRNLRLLARRIVHTHRHIVTLRLLFDLLRKIHADFPKVVLYHIGTHSLSLCAKVFPLIGQHQSILRTGISYCYLLGCKEQLTLINAAKCPISIRESVPDRIRVQRIGSIHLKLQPIRQSVPVRIGIVPRQHSGRYLIIYVHPGDIRKSLLCPYFLFFFCKHLMVFLPGSGIGIDFGCNHINTLSATACQKTAEQENQI